MGGRGAFSGGSLQNGTSREYHQIGTVDDIMIISKFNKKDSINLPVRSNTSNRIYGILDTNGKPKQIGIYKNNHLVTSIDFPDGHKQYVHANDWSVNGFDNKGAISVRIKERKELSDYEKRLVNAFLRSKKDGG